RVIMVDVDGGVDEVGVVPVPLADRVLAPGIERLLGEAEHPAGHRDGDGVGGKVKDQRVHHFGEISRAKYAAARRRISFSCSSVRFRFLSSRNSADSRDVTPGLIPSSTSASFSHRYRHDSEIPKSLAICDSGASPLRATATTSRRNSRGNAFGMANILPARTKSSQARSQPSWGQTLPLPMTDMR